MSLARLIGGAALSRAGHSMIKHGLAMRAGQIAKRTEANTARVRNIVSGVQKQTRGPLTNTPRALSKLTSAGQKRRLDLANRMKDRRAGRVTPPKLSQAQQRAAARQAALSRKKHVSGLISRTRNVTRQGFRGKHELAKTTRTGKFNRGLLASALRSARKSPTSSPMFGYNPGTSQAKTLHLKK